MYVDEKAPKSDYNCIIESSHSPVCQSPGRHSSTLPGQQKEEEEEGGRETNRFRLVGASLGHSWSSTIVTDGLWMTFKSLPARLNQLLCVLSDPKKPLFSLLF